MTIKAVADFIWQDVICWYGLFGRITVDGGAKFKKEVIKIFYKYRVKWVQISAYNTQVSRKIKGGYKLIINALMILMAGKKEKWP